MTASVGFMLLGFLFIGLGGGVFGFMEYGWEVLAVGFGAYGLALLFVAIEVRLIGIGMRGGGKEKQPANDRDETAGSRQETRGL